MKLKLVLETTNFKNLPFVSVNEWDNSKASKLFNNAVKGIWESSAYSSVVASNKPRTVLMVNANATPDNIKFDPGVRSKVSVVATPPDRLSHVHKLAKTKNLVKGAKGDHPYLPSVLGFGKYHNIYVAKGWQLIGPSGCVHCHRTKSPLLTALFLFLSSSFFPPGYFSPRRGNHRVPKFCMGF